MNETSKTQENTETKQGIFSNRNFVWLWLGEGISVLGDQFYLIALPWLVLQLTGDAFIVGSVLALAGIPRAAFMLVGGALTDRFSPRRLMIASNTLSLILVALLAGLVISDQIQVWMLYGFALAFGFVDAFYFPASGAIVTQVVDKEHLQTANSIAQGTNQLSLALGPVLAGGIIALLSGGATDGEEASLTGVGIAFVFDALTFIVANIFLTMVVLREKSTTDDDDKAPDNVLSSIKQGLQYVWNDVQLRTIFLLIAAMNLFINGPLTVGIPVIADTRLPEGAAAFGIIMSAFGGGMLLGIILAGVLPKPPASILGSLLMGIISILGFGIIGVGLSNSTVVIAFLGLIMGVANGYVFIVFVTWLQVRTPENMIGRVMSLLMFSSVGLIPVSNTVTGALISQNLELVFVGMGALMASITLGATLIPSIRSMGDESDTNEHINVTDAIRTSSELPLVTVFATKTSTQEIHII